MTPVILNRKRGPMKTYHIDNSNPEAFNSTLAWMNNQAKIIKYFHEKNACCPHCGMLFTGKAVTTEMVDVYSLQPYIPRPFILKRYRCKKCKNDWEIKYTPADIIIIGEIKGNG